MERITINGKEYQIDIEKCKEQGLLKEEVSYPKDWIDYANNYNHFPGSISPRSHMETNTGNTYTALGKLIVLRDWWWDELCDGWRPNWSYYTEPSYCLPPKYTIYARANDISVGFSYEKNEILSFPTAEIRDKFLKTYRFLIEEAKMFI